MTTPSTHEVTAHAGNDPTIQGRLPTPRRIGERGRMKAKRIRRAGSPWRFRSSEYVGGPGPKYGRNVDLSSVDHPRVEFDELVVGRWLHVEQMDTGRWWMNVGGVTLWVDADRDGKPRRIAVYGPLDYDVPREGCEYDCQWTDRG